VADTPLAGQLTSAVRQAVAEAAGYLALVTRNNPLGSADELLRRPDTDAVLQQALDEARTAAEDLVRQAWYSAGAAASGAGTLDHLQDDVGQIFGSLARLRGLVRHAHASVPQRRFARGAHSPGEHPNQRAAEQRADAVRDALLDWGRQAALRAQMAVQHAEGAGAAAAVLAGALEREARGERLLKRWKAHPESPSCCYWCRRLHGVTIGLRESFIPYLGGPVAMPQSHARHVATEAGERKFGLSLGARIIFTQPPRPYRGRLQGPLLHPFCRCRLEIVRAVGAAEVPPDSGAGRHPAGFVSAADVRALSGDDYQADLAFLRAAVHELDQVLRRLAEGGG
jgi:hypothetical protein